MFTRPFFGASGTVNRAVNFDGANDWLNRGGELTGMVDGKKGIVSVWAKVDETILIKRIILNKLTRFQVWITDALLVAGTDASGSSVMFIVGNTFIVAGVWHHYLVSWDLSVPVRQIYMDDAEDLKSGGLEVDAPIDYATTTPDWGVGAFPTGIDHFDGCLSELYFNSTEYLDLSVEANRRKFITAGKKPVFLGADGSRPTGTQPIVHLRGPAADFVTNLGSGGNFIVNGSLTKCSTRP